MNDRRGQIERIRGKQQQDRSDIGTAQGGGVTKCISSLPQTVARPSDYAHKVGNIVQC